MLLRGYGKAGGDKKEFVTMRCYLCMLQPEILQRLAYFPEGKRDVVRQRKDDRYTGGDVAGGNPGVDFL
jgi:hypothetical protein